MKLMEEMRLQGKTDRLTSKLKSTERYQNGRGILAMKQVLLQYCHYLQIYHYFRATALTEKITQKVVAFMLNIQFSRWKESQQGENNAILDLFITDMHKYYEEPEVLPPIRTSDHRRIVWKSRGRRQLGMNKKIKSVIVRPLRDANLRLFDQFIREFDWSPVFGATGIDDAVCIFLEVTNHMLDIFFPCKLVKVYEDDKPYITGRIKETMLRF